MDRNTLLDLIPAYALGALDTDESVEFEAFLATDSEAQQLLADYQEIAESLVLSVPTRRAPPHLGDDLRARLAANQPTSNSLPHAVPAPTLQPKPVLRKSASNRTWTPGFVLGMAATFVLVVAVLLLMNRPGENQPPTDPAERYQWIVAQADSRRIPITPAFEPNPGGELVLTADGRYGVIQVNNLPEISPDQTFQLWLVDSSGAQSGGLLNFDQSQGANYIDLPLEKPADAYDAFGVSIEPENGSPDPNGPTGSRVFGVQM